MRDRLLQRGRELSWHPEFMRARFESWVQGLTGDWNISRQRFFGVPFPVWYRLDADGEALPDELLTAELARLPVDPSTDCPTGYDESQRGQPGGFVGDADIMDTWATSSLSPQIAGGWIDDPDLFSRVFPMDLRPQAHDIIRTWLFATIVRAERGAPSAPVAARCHLGLDPRPGPEEDLEVQGQCCIRAERAARTIRDRRRAVLGGLRPPRRGHRLRRAADEGGPAPRHQDVERLPLRAVVERRDLSR